ncbi:MAG: ATP-binding protein [Acidimicrobiia bacterium]
MPGGREHPSAVGYRRRVIDDELDELLPALPAVALQGPKGVGKTMTALQRARTVLSLDDEAQRALLEADPGRLDREPGPVLVDEWQRLPSVWDRVRRSVDADPSGGRFLLTGSAAPIDAPVHSGAGRIVTLRMRPLALAERDLAAAAVSLGALLGGGADVAGDSPVSLTDYVSEIVSSGYPAIRPLPERPRAAALDSYLDAVVQRDFPEQGLVVRRPQTLQAWLAAYAAATASTASYNQILKAATPGEGDKPARATVTAYRDVLAQLWLLDPVPGWVPSASPFSRLGQAPKHHLADPALAARLLAATPKSLLATGGAPGDVAPAPRDGPLLGALFESLVTLSVRVYAQAADAAVYHLRTRNGDHEVDLIVEGPDRQVVALEVKLSPTVDDGAVAHLRWLRDHIGDRLADAAVVTTGPYAYRRPDGIAVVPAALLGP